MAQTAQRPPSPPVPPSRTSRHRRTLPPWPRGPKPKRRTELGLLVFAACITVAFYVINAVGADNKIPPHIGPILAVVLGIFLIGHLANRWLAPHANAVVLPLAALLNGIGYVVIVEWNPPAAKSQATWAVVGMVLYVVTLFVVRHSRDLDRYRYLLLLGAGFLLVAPLIPGFGVPVTATLGARLFVHLGPVQFQPIEIAKILLCVFFASYFAEKKELLSIPTARLGNRLVLDPRPLIPILVAWGLAMLVIGLENDTGFAMLIFTMFIALLWISTGRWTYLVFGIALFAIGTVAVTHLVPHVHVRIDDWLHPGSNTQLAYGRYIMANGGIGGSGLGRIDPYPGYIFAITSDMIFSAIADELGFIGAAAVVVAFVLLVGAGLRIAQTARSDFSKLVATGLTVILGFQAFFIMAGVLQILPLTGITLPFVAYGGSSLVANYVLIAMLMRVSEEGASNPEEEALGLTLPGDTGFRPAT
ncbi:MAG TPA: FtsW/RodA/SpoVE family cell cycle protein [Acidimicrobiales bacterium]|nr:FtsW/RodA/SpoVE family cell cycle protein [Acidimicrobiales bacterium]